MSIAQALGIAAAAFLAFAGPDGGALAKSLTHAPDRLRAALERALDRWNDHEAFGFDSDATIPDASIHARTARL